MFSVRELIAAGVVADECECLDAFPLELLAEFSGAVGDVPAMDAIPPLDWDA